MKPQSHKISLKVKNTTINLGVTRDIWQMSWFENWHFLAAKNSKTKVGAKVHNLSWIASLQKNYKTFCFVIK